MYDSRGPESANADRCNALGQLRGQGVPGAEMDDQRGIESPRGTCHAVWREVRCGRAEQVSRDGGLAGRLSRIVGEVYMNAFRVGRASSMMPNIQYASSTPCRRGLHARIRA